MPIKVPNYNSFCISQTEAAKVYNCVDKDLILNPLMFNEDLQPPVENVREEYKLLEQFLDNGEMIANPYEVALMHNNVEEELDSNVQIDPYYPNSKRKNLHKMEDWSVLGTKMHYTCHPSQLEQGVVFSRVEDKLEKGILQKAEQPELLSLIDGERSVEETFEDKFEDVVHYLKVSNEFHDTRDIATTYLGLDNARPNKHQFAEGTFPIFSDSHTWGQSLDGQTMDILLDTGASKCYMSQDYYNKNTHLHSLPKYKSMITRLLVGNGEMVPAHFIVPVVFKIARHMFEIFALVSDIKGSADLVFGVKNMYEVEGEFSCRNSEFRFMNRAVPLYSQDNFTLKPNGKRYVKVIAPFIHKLSGIAIAKIFHGCGTITVKLKLENNVGVINMMNITQNTMVFNRYKSFGIVDIRSLGYYNIRHSVLQFNLSNNFTFANFNKMATAYEDMRLAKAKAKDMKTKPDKTEQKVKVDHNDPYPWLNKDDKRRNMTDEDILYEFIDLSKSDMTEEEKEELMDIILKYQDAFSLRDEIGECPNIRVDIEVIDETPFFVRPFPISQEDKPVMDWQMQRLISLGILSRNTTSHTSPVMLITRKVTKDKRPVVDFRLLNTRIKRQNTASPLLRDIYQMLGASPSDILTCVDLKDAFHSLRLTEKAKDYCGILPYFGSPHYRYEVMPMGLSISPCKWIEYIGYVMENMTHKQNYIAIMDDLLVHSRKKEHMERIEDLLKALIKHGLKLSPKKCQFFKSELVYMGNIFKVTKGKFVITPLKTRVDAILNTPSPETAKECKSFCGVVNYLSLFCPNLQKLLAPIYDLTRKGRPFIWTTIHQETFDKIKQLLAKPPVLSLPDSLGRYTLYSDTSKTHAGSALWQMQQGQNRLIGYASKSLPKACSNYGITELEMTGLLVNMENWKYYLGKRDFDAAVDHAAIPYIMVSKELPTTNRIIRILQRFTKFNFHLYYVKGKDMILCDYLSRIKSDDSDPHGLIPIAFSSIELVPQQYNPKDILDNFYFVQSIGYNVIVEKLETANYFPMTRAQAAASGKSVPEVHGADKPLDPDKKPEHDKILQKEVKADNISKSVPQVFGSPVPTMIPNMPRERAPMRLPVKVVPPSPPSPYRPSMPTPRGMPSPAHIRPIIRTPMKLNTPQHTLVPRTPLAPRAQIPQIRQVHGTPTHHTKIPPPRRSLFDPQGMPQGIPQNHIKPEQLDMPEYFPEDNLVPQIDNQRVKVEHHVEPQSEFQHPSFSSPSQYPSQSVDIQNFKSDKFLDPELEPPLEESSIEAMFRPPVQEDFIVPPTLGEAVKGKTVLAKNLPKQTDIDRLLRVLNRKILHRSRFPESMKDLEAAYMHSGVFKDIYEYLKFNRLPTNQIKAKQVQINSLNYFVLGTLLFRLLPNKLGQMNPVMCIPPSKIDLILDYYHSSLLGGHQGMNKTLMTLQERFFCPRLADYVRSYIVGCHICQLFKNNRRFSRPFYQRKYDINEGTMTNISMDIKHMPISQNGYKFILVMLCEISNFMVTVPLFTATSVEVCKALQDHLICYFGAPMKLICDQDPAFVSHLSTTMMQSYGTKLITVSPTNHRSLLAEHGIKSLSKIMMTHLTGLGLDWDIYCKPAMLVYNSYASPNLADISPFELVFGRKANICPEFEIKPTVPITGTHKDALEEIQKKLKYFRLYLQKFRDQRHALMNKSRVYQGYTAGQIVYLYFPGNSLLNTGSKKIRCEFVGPLAIWKCVSPTQFILMSLDGKLYPYVIEDSRIKPGFVRTTKGNVTHLSTLRQVVKSGELIDEQQNVK